MKKVWGAALAATLIAAGALTAPAVAQAESSPTPAATPVAGAVTTDDATYAKALKSPDWVKTPNGLSRKSCITQLPAGATFDDGTITLASGQKRAVKPCGQPRLVTARQAARGYSTTAGPAPAASPMPSGPVPAANGWWISTWWDSPTWLSYLSVRYAVPVAPRKNGATNFLFSSFEPSAGNAIIQPVLTYGPSAAAGSGNFWHVNSWYVWGSNSVIGPTVAVSTGDTIYSSMTSDSCNANGSGCHWLITTTNGHGSSSPISIWSDAIFKTAQGGVLESYNAVGCVMMPGDGHGVFRSIAIRGSAGTAVTPSFHVWKNIDQCSVSETFTTTSADIRFQYS